MREVIEQTNGSGENLSNTLNPGLKSALFRLIYAHPMARREKEMVKLGNKNYSLLALEGHLFLQDEVAFQWVDILVGQTRSELTQSGSKRRVEKINDPDYLIRKTIEHIGKARKAVQQNNGHTPQF